MSPRMKLTFHKDLTAFTKNSGTQTKPHDDKLLRLGNRAQEKSSAPTATILANRTEARVR